MGQARGLLDGVGLDLGGYFKHGFLRMMITLKFRIKNRQLKTYSFEG